MKKIMCVLAALLLAVCFVWAGGSKESAAKPADGKLQGEIVFWHSFTQGPRMERLQKAADSFMAANPGTKITIQTFSWADFYTKWTTGLASGNVPDMSSALPAQVVEMLDADAVLQLDDLVDRIGRDRFYSSALTEMTKDGKCYAIPLYSTAAALWYRKDLLKKYNLSVPQTWDELYEASVKIQKGENGAVYGNSFPSGMNDLLATRWLHLYVRSAGDSLLTKDGKANLTSKAALDGIKYWVKVYKNCSPADSINFNTLDQATLYYQGRLAFDFNTGFHISGVQANSPLLMDSIDCAPIPRINATDPIRGFEANNTPLVIWKASKNPEICKAFMEYLYKPETYVDFLLSVPVGMMSALKDVGNDPKYLSNPIVQKFGNAQKVLNQMLDGSTAIGMEHGPKSEAGLLTSQRVIEEMFHNILLKNVPVEQAAKAAEDKLNRLFKTLG